MDAEQAPLGSSHTVSQLKEALQQTTLGLQESERRFRELAEMLPQVVFEAGLDGRFTFCNRHAFTLFGYPTDTPVSQLSPFDMVAEPDRARAIENVQRRIKGERLGYTEYQCVRLDGTTFPGLVFASPIVRDGHTVGLRGILIDISELKQAQAEQKRMRDYLHQAQKLEAIGLVAGTIAHDFRNQLTVIQGFAEMLSHRPLGGPGDHFCVGEILKAAERSVGLTSQLLAFARRDKLRPEVVNVSELMRDLGRALPALLGEKIRLSVEVDGDARRAVVDGGQLRQALLNLAANARDAMSEGGALRIRSACVELPDRLVGTCEAARAGRYVAIVMEDTGVGMSEDVKSRMYEPFFTTKEMGKGTGLGLAMVYGFVKQSGGVIECQSEPGKGTRFALYFPLAEGGECKRDHEFHE